MLKISPFQRKKNFNWNSRLVKKPSTKKEFATDINHQPTIQTLYPCLFLTGEVVETSFTITFSKYRYFAKTEGNQISWIIKQKKKQVIFTNIFSPSYLSELIVFRFAEGDLWILQHFLFENNELLPTVNCSQRNLF